jgi:hypothetical protein
MKKYLIDELNADVCLCIGIKENYNHNNPFHQIAKHRFLFEEKELSSLTDLLDNLYDKINTDKYEKLNYCQYLNSLECKKYLSGLNDLLNDT